MAGDGEHERPPGGLSRRDFLCGTVVAVGVGLLPGEVAGAQRGAAKRKAAQRAAGGGIVGPGPVPMRFRVNGNPHEARLEPRTTLLEALRGPLDLTGAKEVCDRGACGACTVLLDGKAVYACSVLAIEAQEAQIETVEGLGRHDKLSPLQAAFVEHDARGCGACVPGFVMAAKALLAQTPNPGRAEIHRGLAGNVCGCGTYAGVREAVLAAARVKEEGKPGETPENEPADSAPSSPRRKGGRPGEEGRGGEGPRGGAPRWTDG